jgi:hypothetical protein
MTMDIYTATEEAFKHGYEKGYAAGKPKWIPVTDRLPEKYTSAIVYRKDKYFYMLRYSPALGWHFYDSEWGDVTVDDVTHWMPLPEPPKEAK